MNWCKTTHHNNNYYHYRCSCFVQSNGSQSRENFWTACICSDTDSDLWRLRRYISSSGSSRIPLMTFKPKPLLNCSSSSIWWRNPLFRPNSTWKYGMFFGILPRNPFESVWTFLATAQSSSASRISWYKWKYQYCTEFIAILQKI